MAFSQLWISAIWIAVNKNIRYANLCIIFQFLNHNFFKEKLFEVNKSGNVTIQAIIHHHKYHDNVQVFLSNNKENHSFSKKYQTQCIIAKIQAKIHNSLLKIIILLNNLQFGKISLNGRTNKITSNNIQEYSQNSL